VHAANRPAEGLAVALPGQDRLEALPVLPAAAQAQELPSLEQQVQGLGGSASMPDLALEPALAAPADAPAAGASAGLRVDHLIYKRPAADHRFELVSGKPYDIFNAGHRLFLGSVFHTSLSAIRGDVPRY